MKKRYLLDTSVLLHDPESLFHFEDNDVYIPLEVITELDMFKHGTEERNVNAREVHRRLEELMKGGIPKEGILLGKGGKERGGKEEKEGGEENYGRLYFHLPGADEKSILERGSDADPILIHWAQELRRHEPERPVSIVAKDLNLRIRARILGVQAEDYKHDKADIDLNEFFKQQIDFTIDSEFINELYKGQKLAPPPEILMKLEENQYLILKQGQQSVVARYKNGTLERLREKIEAERIKPRNLEQRFLMDACLDPDLTIISSLGRAGTGKTIITLAAGLSQVLHDGQERYNKVVVIRPILETGKELGFLPGEVEDKISPHFQPIEHILELIIGKHARDYPGREEKLEYKPINFVRGDTIDKSFIIVDEAQNFTRKELKLIGTRMGEGSKIVFLGDPFQIDHPYLDEKSNGLTVTTDILRRKKLPHFAYTILQKVERSKEAGIFAEYL